MIATLLTSLLLAEASSAPLHASGECIRIKATRFPQNLQRQALACPLEFAHRTVWPTKDEFGVLSAIGGGNPSDFLPEAFVTIDPDEPRLLTIKQELLHDASLLLKIGELRRLLNLAGLILTSGASSIARRLGIEAEIRAEVELGIDDESREPISLANVRQRGGQIILYFNLSASPALLSMAAVHEVTELYEAVKVLDGGIMRQTWEVLKDGTGLSMARGYFHWKALEAEIRTSTFASLGRDLEIYYAYELFSIGFGLLRMYQAIMRDSNLKNPALSAAIKDLARLERIMRPEAYIELKMNIFDRWRRISRTQPLNAYAAMSEDDREKHLAWLERFAKTTRLRFLSRRSLAHRAA